MPGVSIPSTGRCKALALCYTSIRPFSGSILLARYWSQAKDFIPSALASGRVKSLLKTKVAGKGVDSIQFGIDMVKAGVSGTQVVVVVSMVWRIACW